MESSRSSRSSSPAEERQFLESWTPEPLVPTIDIEQNKHVLEPRIITSKSGKYITVDGVKCLNLCTHNYLGLADDPRLEKASIEAVRRYGVGSCGPRAFYGTMDVHLSLEEEIAQFLNLQEAVLYSYGFSTIASAIAAYAKPSDVIFVDEHCNFAIQQGMVASRSRIIKFKHNNVRHLEQLIEEFAQEQLKKFGKTNKIRTFLIVEGLYAKTGDLCPLTELIDLKKKYKVRLFVDESRSFGVLGSEGKGITEHFNLDINDVDLTMGTLENALCAYGGFCAGSTFVVDHQRLAGSGYCFSASLPPLQTQVALESLRIIRETPSLIRDAQNNFKYAHEVLNKLTKLKNISHPLSPIKVLTLKCLPFSDPEDPTISDKLVEKVLSDICTKILEEEQIAITVARYMVEEEMTSPITSIRLIISGCLVHEDIIRVFLALEKFSCGASQLSNTPETCQVLSD